MFRHPEMLASSLEHEYQQHLEIVKAIEIHDAEGAMQHTVDHIQDLGHELVSFLDIPADLLEKRQAQIEPMLCIE
jgi:DNA-binding GntR family transcriptional regulator